MAPSSSAAATVVVASPQPTVVSVANANAATTVVASPQPTVSVANLTPGQPQTAQRIVSQSAAGGIQRTLVSANTGKPLTQQQINLFKQQAMLKKTQEAQAAARARQQQQQQQATVVATTSTGQKVSVAVTPSGQLAAISSGALTGAVTVVTQAGQVAGQQAKAHLIRQLNAPVAAGNNAGAKTSTANVRSMTEGEMKLILARQQQQQQQGQQQQGQQQGSAGAKAQIASIQVPAGGQPMSAAAQQLLQAGIQIQTSGGGTPVAALVKQQPQGGQQQQQQSQQQAVTIPLQGMNVNAVRAAALRGGQVATASPQQLTIIHR